MASSRSATDIIEHVEHMLESLSAPDLSAKCFADECLALEAFLEMHGDSLFRTEKLDEASRAFPEMPQAPDIHQQNILPINVAQISCQACAQHAQ